MNEEDSTCVSQWRRSYSRAAQSVAAETITGVLIQLLEIASTLTKSRKMIDNNNNDIENQNYNEENNKPAHVQPSFQKCAQFSPQILNNDHNYIKTSGIILSKRIAVTR